MLDNQKLINSQTCAESDVLLAACPSPLHGYFTAVSASNIEQGHSARPRHRDT